MKKIFNILIILVVSSFLLVSCDSLLDADSEQYTNEEDFRMSSPNDSLYSIVGVMSKLQLLGDRYVLLGELRGDLMATTDDASLYLKQINDFKISKDNPYASTKEYYAVINNCNYIISNVDTTLRAKDDKPNYRVMAAAKSIRAWTYLQLVLNYGSAKYFTEPILSAEDAQKTYKESDFNEIANYLIEDLLPFKDVKTLKLGVFESFSSDLSIFPIKFVLGDIYLWKGDYDKAANMYYDLMYNDELIINELYSNTYTFTNNVPVSASLYWNYTMMPGSAEVISALASSPDYGSPFTMDSLSFNYEIAPTSVAVLNWMTPLYFESENASVEGDLRMYASYNTGNVTYTNVESSKNPYIIKYDFMETETEKRIVIYRNSLLYLRYAEAVNRLGCPNLAFAAIKTGLNDVTQRKAYITKELAANYGSTHPYYLDFSAYRFQDNIGTRMRGLGKTDKDTTGYIIKGCATKTDSILFVEDKIVDELAAEMAFEGNRYQDLMRIAIRRNNPAYLADKVSAKFSTNKEAIRTKLMDVTNWYLPK